MGEFALPLARNGSSTGTGGQQQLDLYEYHRIRKILENMGLHKGPSNRLGFSDETDKEGIPDFQEPRHDLTGFEEEGLVQAANNKEQHPTISEFLKSRKGSKSGFSNRLCVGEVKINISNIRHLYLSIVFSKLFLFFLSYDEPFEMRPLPGYEFELAQSDQEVTEWRRKIDSPGFADPMPTH